MANTMQWGVLPTDVVARLRQTEWDNRRNLKLRLKSQRPFPISISLKPPTGQQAFVSLAHFNTFYNAWKNFAYPDWVKWQHFQFKQLSEQNIPIKLVIPTLTNLMELLGQQEVLKIWQHKIAQMLQQCFVCEDDKQALFYVLIEYLEKIETDSEQDWRLLISMLSQLKQGMGEGCYLRALPLYNVHTKFLEENLPLVEAICDVLQHGQVLSAGGLLAWLNCLERPKGWLLVKPLCDDVQQRLSGLTVFQFSIDVLRQFELPAEHILVVENIESGLALPRVANTIVVCGGGKNIDWMDADWLKTKKVSYWGDIDSEGLYILSMVRQKIPHVTALMMNEATVLKFEDRMGDEPNSIFKEPEYLTTDELHLFYQLRNNHFKNRRLEQEKISMDWIQSYLNP